MVKKLNLKNKIKTFFKLPLKQFYYFDTQENNKDYGYVKYVNSETFYLNKNKLCIQYKIAQMSDVRGHVIGIVQGNTNIYLNNEFLCSVDCEFKRKDFYNEKLNKMIFNDELIKKHPKLSEFNNTSIKKYEYTLDKIHIDFSNYLSDFIYIPFQK